VATKAFSYDSAGRANEIDEAFAGLNGSGGAAKWISFTPPRAKVDPP
jgi:hypothetical protein